MFTDAYVAAMAALRPQDSPWLGDADMTVGEANPRPWISSLSAFWPGMQVHSQSLIKLPGTHNCLSCLYTLQAIADGLHTGTHLWQGHQAAQLAWLQTVIVPVMTCVPGSSPHLACHCTGVTLALQRPYSRQLQTLPQLCRR